MISLAWAMCSHLLVAARGGAPWIPRCGRGFRQPAVGGIEQLDTGVEGLAELASSAAPPRKWAATSDSRGTLLSACSLKRALISCKVPLEVLTSCSMASRWRPAVPSRASARL